MAEIMINESIVDKINTIKKRIITDSYIISIGEIISMYKEKELIFNPDFKNPFVWSISKQTQFIESILMGIPLNSIFVYQNEIGKWEIVDGTQRISTILQFVGILKNEIDENLPQTILEKTKKIPDLEGMSWDKFPIQVKLDFKRSRLDIKIIRYLSDENAKFEVFQSLRNK